MQPAHDHPEADAAELSAAPRTEADHVHAVPAAPLVTNAQWHGLWFGALVGGALGVVVFGLLGLIPFADIDVGWRVLTTAIVGALAGGTAGAVYFGGRAPEVEQETTDAGGIPSIGSSPRDPGNDASGRRR